MKKINDLNIDDVFVYGGVELMVIENDAWSCEGCYFNNSNNCYNKDIPSCNNLSIKDKKDVIFVEM